MFMVMSSSLVLSGLGVHVERANPEIGLRGMEWVLGAVRRGCAFSSCLLKGDRLLLT